MRERDRERQRDMKYYDVDASLKTRREAPKYYRETKGEKESFKY